MPAKMAGSAFLPSFGVPELRPPSALPGGLVKKRPKRKNPPSIGGHLENPGLRQHDVAGRHFCRHGPVCQQLKGENHGYEKGTRRL